MSQRQSHLFVDNGCQGQRLRPYLHIAHSHRIRGLQRMASLHSPLALEAAAHSDIETAHYGSPDNLFLILCFAAFPLHAARRNAGSAPAEEPRSVPPPAMGWGGMPVGRSRSPVCGPAASDCFRVAP